MINVQNFLALPSKDFDFKISGGGFMRITVKSFGYARALVENVKRECYRCGKLGHLAADCPTRPTKFSWKCTVCKHESTEFGCTVKRCMKTLARVTARTTSNMHQDFDLNKVRKMFGSGLDSWLKVELETKLVDPTAGQIMLAIKNSDAIRESLAAGTNVDDYMDSYRLIQRWVTLKLEEYDKLCQKQLKKKST